MLNTPKFLNGRAGICKRFVNLTKNLTGSFTLPLNAASAAVVLAYNLGNFLRQSDGELENILENLRSMKKITKEAHAGHEEESKWKMLTQGKGGIMARLLIKTDGLERQAIELRLGVNRVGRDPELDFSVNHPTVSTNHCELVVSNDGVLLRDCDSTNGTFVNGKPVVEARLLPGQTVGLGSVELFVENTDVNVAIPQFERERPKPPVVLGDGSILCPRHAPVAATHKCTHCSEVMCDNCVRVMKRKGDCRFSSARFAATSAS
jgi:hypothetical protein